jgi:taurine dioxygenase
LSPQQLVEFSTFFGEPETRAHPSHRDFPGLPEVKVLRSDGVYAIGKDDSRHSMEDFDGWHTDGSVRADTNKWISFLYAEQVPSYGRDTIYADMEAVYDHLSPTMQAFLEGLEAVHAWPVPSKTEGYEPITHPVVNTDPVTGRRGVYVNQMYTTHIVGLRRDESDAILKVLYEGVHRPEVQLRLAWKHGSLVIWDNVRTQHSHISDRAGLRIMHRVMVTPAS